MTVLKRKLNVSEKRKNKYSKTGNCYKLFGYQMFYSQKLRSLELGFKYPLLHVFFFNRQETTIHRTLDLIWLC